MNRLEWEESGFGKIGKKGRHGGICTIMNDLPVGTKFHIDNGYWDGEIVEIDGVKHLSIDGERTINLEQNPEYVLEITIEGVVPEKEKYVKLKHVEELLALIHTRDGFHDWSTSYEKYDRKVKNTIEWLKRNAKELD